MYTTTKPGPTILLSARDTARALSISERTLFSLTQTGALPCVRVGTRAVRYSMQDIERFIEERRQG
jgi:predicted DNA-binding transcriptional regulator AlpA